jgi:hypothetical protein
MSMTFRAQRIDQPLFLPPTVGELVAKQDLVRLVLSLVRDDLDLIELTSTYGSEQGHPDDGALQTRGAQSNDPMKR